MSAMRGAHCIIRQHLGGLAWGKQERMGRGQGLHKAGRKRLTSKISESVSQTAGKDLEDTVQDQKGRRITWLADRDRTLRVLVKSC